MLNVEKCSQKQLQVGSVAIPRIIHSHLSLYSRYSLLLYSLINCTKGCGFTAAVKFLTVRLHLLRDSQRTRVILRNYLKIIYLRSPSITQKSAVSSLRMKQVYVFYDGYILMYILIRNL